MLENQHSQLVAGLQELYKRIQSGQGWTGPPLKETSHGMPLTHDILEHLGALKKKDRSSGGDFEAGHHALQQRLITNAASLMHQEYSHDGSSESAPSTVYEPLPQQPKFTNPFRLKQSPPAPPNQSPYPQSAPTVHQHKVHTSSQVTAPSNLAWPTPMSDFNERMGLNQFDLPTMETTLDITTVPPQMYREQMSQNINPFLTMEGRAGEDELQRYINPVMM